MRTPRFNTRKPDGRICCLGDYGCQWCREQEAGMRTESYLSPNPWALTAAQQAEREATPELRAEIEYKARRTREFAAEYARAAAFDAARPAPRRLSAAELEQYAPPNGYAIKEKR